jgi:hypothetical protein
MTTKSAITTSIGLAAAATVLALAGASPASAGVSNAPGGIDFDRACWDQFSIELGFQVRAFGNPQGARIGDLTANLCGVGDQVRVPNWSEACRTQYGDSNWFAEDNFATQVGKVYVKPVNCARWLQYQNGSWGYELRTTHEVHS